MKVSSKELKERLEWSYEKKIDHSLYIIDSFLQKYAIFLKILLFFLIFQENLNLLPL